MTLDREAVVRAVKSGWRGGATQTWFDTDQAVDAILALVRGSEKRKWQSGTCCDLCEEPVSETDWRWVEEGWSLACMACLGKITAAKDAEIGRLQAERTEYQQLAARVTWEKVTLEEEKRALLAEIERLRKAIAAPEPERLG